MESSMLQPKIQPSDGLSFRTCSVFIFMVLQSVGEQSQLICPHQPIVALAGDDVILPCHLEPPINADSETVVWIRPDLDPEYIHFHEDGGLISKNQNPSYSSRTALFVDELKNGNVSMKIFKVKLSDTGKYFCILRSMMKEASIQLTVGVVSTPVIEFVSNKSREVVLQCEAKGWYPEPEVFWLDGEGNLLSAGPTETVRGPDDLYTVSRRLTVEKSHHFICRVQQKNINQIRETHFYVPGHFFTVQSLSWIWIINIIIIIFVTISVCLLCCTFARWIYKSNEEVHCVKRVMSRIQEKPEVKKNDAKETAHELHPILKGKKKLEEGQEQLEEGQEQLEEGQEQLEEGQEQLEEGQEQLEEREQLEEEREQLEEGQEQLEEREQQDRTERLQTEEASGAGDNTEEETKDN